jgi:hypothetical protein
MYSGTGVCAGHAYWQSTTLWKYSGLLMSVGFTDCPLPHGFPRRAPAHRRGPSSRPCRDAMVKQRTAGRARVAHNCP